MSLGDEDTGQAKIDLRDTAGVRPVEVHFSPKGEDRVKLCERSIFMKMICQEITSFQEKKVCLSIRLKIFVSEQKTPVELEMDGLDNIARHFAVKMGDKIIATCRIRRMGSAVKIERVAVLKDFRHKGVGRRLMKYVLQDMRSAGNIQLFKLRSRVSNAPFYEKLGFRAHGNEYINVNIPHYDMVKEM